MAVGGIPAVFSHPEDLGEYSESHFLRTSSRFHTRTYADGAQNPPVSLLQLDYLTKVHFESP